MTGWPSFAPAENAENGPLAIVPASENAGVASVLPPAKVSPRLKLGSVRDVRKQLAVIYREARNGTLKPETATKLAFLLDLMARIIERSDLEARLVALEQRGPAR